MRSGGAGWKYSNDAANQLKAESGVELEGGDGWEGGGGVARGVRRPQDQIRQNLAEGLTAADRWEPGTDGCFVW